MMTEWREAFWAVLSGVPVGAIRIEKWKRMVLSLAIVWTVFSPLITYYMSLPYQGNIPSNSSMIKQAGRLEYRTEQRGVKQLLQLVLIGDGGRIIEFQDPTGLEDIRSWERKTGIDQVYVEGFYLRDGEGLFWPTYIATLNGKPLATREEQLRKLSVARDPFGKVLLVMYFYSLPMWIISLINIYKIKSKIGV